jgi:hypothetical protein
MMASITRSQSRPCRGRPRVADLDEAGERRVEERGGRALRALSRPPCAKRLRAARLLPLLSVRLGRDDVEEDDRYARVGEVGSDAAAHDACADDADLPEEAKR